MNKAKAFATLLFSVLGVFGANEYYKPKTIKDLLKWRGVKLSSEDKVWKSMFFENQKELENMKILDSNSLWNWCNEKFKSSNLNEENFNEAKKYCSDNPTTIMGRIIREGEEKRIIDKEDMQSFKINYLLSSNKEEINKLIGLNGNGWGKGTLEEESKKLSKYCHSQERVNILNAKDKDKLSNFKKRCYNLKVKNFSDLLKKQGRRVASTPDEFKRKFNDEKLKYVTELKNEIIELLKKDDGAWKNRLKSLLRSAEEGNSDIYRVWLTISEDEKEVEFLFNNYGWNIFRFWCQEKLQKPLLMGKEINLENFNKFSYRCSVEK